MVRFRLVDPAQAPLRFQLRHSGLIFAADISSNQAYDANDASTFFESEDAVVVAWLLKIRELVEV